jgi:DinB superfamily
VVRHLADAELVWGFRVRMMLTQDRPALAGYDQDAWANSLHYEKSSIAIALEEFRVIRGSNVRLLEGASPLDLGRVGVHAERGEETLEELMRLCAGHDLQHLAQLARIRHAIRSER